MSKPFTLKKVKTGFPSKPMSKPMSEPMSKPMYKPFFLGKT